MKMNINDTASDGRNCYLKAAGAGNLEIVQYLYENYQTLRTSKDLEGRTALAIVKSSSGIYCGSRSCRFTDSGLISTECWLCCKSNSGCRYQRWWRG